uniref:Uncharacterized protein n=1 Tax=Siphoviridae sp. ctwQT14 TaxID=2827971 RepID=A0A8S5TJT9_9CAUD|nr:MAG TPA: hypothetical protein [Siphoviridae sp. ctwQT14]
MDANILNNLLYYNIIRILIIEKNATQTKSSTIF